MGPYPANPEPKGGVATRKANFLEYLRVAKVFWISYDRANTLEARDRAVAMVKPHARCT